MRAMNSYLLDTHTLLWWLTNSDKIGARCREVISNPENDIYVSPISLWEISIKKSIGKLKAPDNMAAICMEKGFLELKISLKDGQAMQTLPCLHKDPFDRMLIVQAINNRLIIITNDKIIKNYEVKTLPAGN